MRPLQTILEQEIAALGAVLRTLEDEHAALLQRAPDALLAASNAKAEAVAHALGLEQQRRQPGQQSGQQSGMSPAEDGLFAKLGQLAGECRNLNDRNGQLIRGQRRRIEGALNVLRGRAATPDIYGRDGTGTFSRGPGTPLASY